LDFAGEVLLHGLLAGDAEDVVGAPAARPPAPRGADETWPEVDPQVLAVRDEVLAFDAGLALDDDGAFAAPLLAEDFHDAVDLGDDGRVLGLAGLENFGGLGADRR